MVIDAEKVSPIVPPTALDVETVTALLGRPPSVGFEVVVMNKAGAVSYTHLTLPTNREV